MNKLQIIVKNDLILKKITLQSQNMPLKIRRPKNTK